MSLATYSNVPCPVVFRGPNGAAAGVGAQHSQDYAGASVSSLRAQFLSLIMHNTRSLVRSDPRSQGRLALVG